MDPGDSPWERRGDQMKTSTIGIISAAILTVAAGVGFGLAQAGETNSIGEFMEWQTPEQGSSSSLSVENRPVWSLEDQVALGQSDSSSTYVLVLSSAIDVDYAADGNPSSDVAQARGAVETGRLPEMSNADSSIGEIEQHNYLGGEDIDSPKAGAEEHNYLGGEDIDD